LAIVDSGWADDFRLADNQELFTGTTGANYRLQYWSATRHSLEFESDRYFSASVSFFQISDSFRDLAQSQTPIDESRVTFLAWMRSECTRNIAQVEFQEWTGGSTMEGSYRRSSGIHHG